MISAGRYETRREKLKRVVKKQALAGLLVTSPVNVRYLTGFTGDSTWLLIGPEVEMLLSDGRFTVQLQEECPDVAAEIRPVSLTLLQAARKLLTAQGLKKCGFEGQALSYAQAVQLQEGVTSCQWKSVSGLIEELRAIKDADEIAEIRLAIRQAEKGFDLTRATLTGDMTELEVAHTLEAGMRRFGATGASFEIIAAVGERAAKPHARPGQVRCEESPWMLIDWGARTAGGYVSDLTRMILTGSISAKLQRMYEVVLQAQQQAIAAIAPGVAAREVDRAARGVIEAAGIGPHFNHSLGHGIGLEVHEAIRLGTSSDDVLKPGMVVTVEPGVYFPGWGGIRIEDDVLVTRDGYEVLSSWPTDLESCRLMW